jgi:ferric-dicitrate binding protein FerR (iron transport regulator)
MNIADLLSDETFINYCRYMEAPVGPPPEEVPRWESWIGEDPQRRALVECAKTEYSQLFKTLAMMDLDEQEALLRSRLGDGDGTPVVKMERPGRRKTGRNSRLLFRVVAAAAVVSVIVVIGAHNHYKRDSGKQALKVFAAANGERKNFQLPDGSDVSLNGGSRIDIPENYGVSTREIYLEGEAFFDVKHGSNLPFVVHTAAMDIKALGTAFDVKAYPGERLTETSLVQGLVEVTIKEEGHRKVLLHPHQKIKWTYTGTGGDANTNNGVQQDARVKIDTGKIPAGVQHMTKTDNGDLLETAWTQNKLVFTDEPFEGIAVLLERWYGVRVEFADDGVRGYRFTGIFEKEQLGAVLSILKETKNFNYEMIPGEVMKVRIYK